MSRGLPAADGQAILVDDEDYLALSQYVWHTDPAGKVYRLQYVGKKKYKTFMDQQILSSEKCFVILHVDGNELNCSRQNLKALERTAARKEANRKASRCRGVLRLRNGMYRAQLHWMQIQIVIGFFETEADASAAYSLWAWEYNRYFLPNHSKDNPELARVRAMLDQNGLYLNRQALPQIHRPEPKFRGVKFDGHAKTHIASIGFGRRKIKLGKRKLAAEAARLYDAAALIRFGNKAKLNFPNAQPDSDYIANAQRILAAA